MPAVSRGKHHTPEPEPSTSDRNPWTSSHDALRCYGHSARVFDVAFKPGDAKAMASVADDQMLRIWQLNDANSTYEQVGPTAAVLPSHRLLNTLRLARLDGAEAIRPPCCE